MGDQGAYQKMNESAFLTDLVVKELDDSRFQLLMSFDYRSALLGKVISVAPGTVTDFASVPRIPIIFDILGDIAHEPAVLHDDAYQRGYTDRATADKLLLEAMEVVGIPAWKRYQIYWGVRIGAWTVWNNYRKLDGKK